MRTRRTQLKKKLTMIMYKRRSICFVKTNIFSANNSVFIFRKWCQTKASSTTGLSASMHFFHNSENSSRNLILVWVVEASFSTSRPQKVWVFYLIAGPCATPKSCVLSLGGGNYLLQGGGEIWENNGKLKNFKSSCSYSAPKRPPFMIFLSKSVENYEESDGVENFWPMVATI